MRDPSVGSLEYPADHDADDLHVVCAGVDASRLVFWVRALRGQYPLFLRRPA